MPMQSPPPHVQMKPNFSETDQIRQVLLMQYGLNIPVKPIMYTGDEQSDSFTGKSERMPQDFFPQALEAYQLDITDFKAIVAELNQAARISATQLYQQANKPKVGKTRDSVHANPLSSSQPPLLARFDAPYHQADAIALTPGEIAPSGAIVVTTNMIKGIHTDPQKAKGVRYLLAHEFAHMIINDNVDVARSLLAVMPKHLGRGKVKDESLIEHACDLLAVKLSGDKGGYKSWLREISQYNRAELEAEVRKHYPDITPKHMERTIRKMFKSSGSETHGANLQERLDFIDQATGPFAGRTTER